MCLGSGRMVFSQQFLDELKMRVNLSEIVGKRVKLLKKGQEFLGLCPFHNEKTPSFTVNDDKRFYHCFGCHAHGSAIDFVMETEKLSFKESIEKLASLSGIEIPKNSYQEKQKDQLNEKLLELLEKSTCFFQNALISDVGKNARQYLASRGIDNKMIKTFRIGFAPTINGGLKAFLLNSGVKEELLILSGLVAEPNGNEKRNTYDRFRNRIIFPINNKRGKVIGFGGRALGNNAPKYLNSPETPIYHKGNELYGLSHAIQKARKEDTIIVTEGYLDVISFHQAGFMNMVAPLGTAITESQIKTLWNTVTEPIFCFDGDEAGKRAALKTAIKVLPLIKPGLTVRFADLPLGEDPDSLIKKQGPEVITEILSKSIPLSQFFWKIETNGALISTLPEDRAACHKRLKNYASLIQDTTMKSHFLKFFNSQIWETSKNPSYSSHGSKSFKKSTWPTNMQLELDAGPKAKIDIDFFRHSILIAVLINHPEAYDHIGERLGSIICPSTSLDKLRQEVLKICEGQTKIDSEFILDQLRKLGYSEALESVLSEDVLEHAYFIRLGTPIDEVTLGWDELFNQVKAKELAAEIEVAEKTYASQPNNDTWNRLVALRKQEIENKPDELAY